MKQEKGSIYGLEIVKNLDEVRSPENIIPIEDATGVILCGGLGWRMRDVIGDETIKPLVSISGSESLIDNPLYYMRLAGVRNIVFLTSSHAADIVRDHLSLHYDRYDGIEYFVDDEPPQGTVPLMNKFIRETNPKTPIIKANGDEVYKDLDLFSMYEQHSIFEQPVTGLVTSQSDGTEKYRFELDENNRVVGMQKPPFEKDSYSHSETGLWIIDPSEFESMKRESSWGEFLESSMGKGNLYGYKSHVEFLNVNTPEDLKSVRGF